MCVCCSSSEQQPARCHSLLTRNNAGERLRQLKSKAGASGKAMVYAWGSKLWGGKDDWKGPAGACAAEIKTRKIPNSNRATVFISALTTAWNGVAHSSRAASFSMTELSSKVCSRLFALSVDVLLFMALASSQFQKKRTRLKRVFDAGTPRRAFGPRGKCNQKQSGFISSSNQGDRCEPPHQFCLDVRCNENKATKDGE